MKKLIAILMTLMLVLSGTAFADQAFMTLEEPPVNASNRYALIEFVEPDSSFSYVLLGSGTGAEVFSSFGIDMEDYEKGYERAWQFLSMMEPAMTIVGSPNLNFHPDVNKLYTEVSANGNVIAQLSGFDVFAIISEEAADLVPAISDNCSVVFWNSDGTVAYPMNGAAGTVCIHCGKLDDGSDVHDTVINRYCKDGHTECMGNPMHYCEECEHEYECSKSGSHTKCAECGQPWCYKEEGDHKEAECGHRGCVIFGNEDAHELCEVCGNYLCDGEDHEHAASEAPETEAKPEDGAASEPEKDENGEIFIETDDFEFGE